MTTPCPICGAPAGEPHREAVPDYSKYVGSCVCPEQRDPWDRCEACELAHSGMTFGIGDRVIVDLATGRIVGKAS